MRKQKQKLQGLGAPVSRISTLWRWIVSMLTLVVGWVRARVFLLRRGVQETFNEGSEALRKIADARVCAPDTVSAGECRGGPAIFFRHNDGMEVFVGNTYDHAANEFLQWITVQNRADEAPKTSKTTKLNRAQRRFWASNKRPKLS